MLKNKKIIIIAAILILITTVVIFLITNEAAVLNYPYNDMVEKYYCMISPSFTLA